jgi:hypothetical protein
MFDDDRVVVYDNALDPHTARIALERLRWRAREAAELAAALTVTAFVLGWLGGAASVVPVIVGAVFAVGVWGAALSERTGLLSRLVGQRSAYVIPDVAAAGAHLATPQERARLAEALVRLVAAAEDARSRSGVVAPAAARVGRHADELRTLVAALRDERVEVHPSTVVLVRGLLEWPLRSPLYNVEIPETTLRIVLGRIRASVHEPRPAGETVGAPGVDAAGED